MALANRYRSVSTKINPSELFLADQRLGGFFDEVAKALVSRRVSITFSGVSGGEIRLFNETEWQTFITAHLKSSDQSVTDRAHAERLFDNIGIALGNFVRLLEDLSVSGLSSIHCDFKQNSDLASLVNLYSKDEIYALIPDSAGEDAFIKPRRDWPWRTRIAADKEEFLELEITPAMYPRFVLNAPEILFGRDREEFEAHADFEPNETSWNLFPQKADVETWIPLDLTHLPEKFWENKVRMDVIHRFVNPLHLEVDQRESPPYHINRETFLDVYLDTEDRTLTQGRLSLRARVRQEQARALVQYREELPNLSPDGWVVRREWERRIQGDYFGDKMTSLEDLVSIAQFGWHGGAPMPEARRLMQRLIDLGLHTRTKNLRVVPDLIIFQKRRRTNLQLDSIDEVKTRLASVSAMAATLNPIPPALQDYVNLIRIQLGKMENVSAILVKYGFRRMIQGEAILISQDRWAVFEPGAYAHGEWPTEFGDKGQRGRGIRLEAELDQNSSDQLQLTTLAIQKLIEAGVGDIQKFEQELKIVRDFQEGLFQDVKTTVKLQKEKLLAAGFSEIKDLPYAKSLTGQTMIREGQGFFRRGHRYWL